MIDIKGYEGLYKITEDGKIYNVRRNKFLSNVLADRYLIVLLYKKGKRKRYYVHRLVADAYCENTMHKEYVNHKDFNKQNNHYTNLEWVTAKENTLHYVKSNRYIRPTFSEQGKRTLKEKLNKKVLCKDTGVIYESISNFAVHRNISLSQASQKLNGKLKNNLNSILL